MSAETDFQALVRRYSNNEPVCGYTSPRQLEPLSSAEVLVIVRADSDVLARALHSPSLEGALGDDIGAHVPGRLLEALGLSVMSAIRVQALKALLYAVTCECERRAVAREWQRAPASCAERAAKA